MSGRVFTSVTALCCLFLGACTASTGGYGNLHHRLPLAGDAASAPDTADDQVMYLQLIRKMQKQGMYYASLAHIDEYTRRYGTPPELRILHADALRKTGQPELANRTYRVLLDGPQAAAAWHGLGLLAAARDDYTRAARDLDQAVSLAPIDATYLGDLGYARLHAGDLDGARAPLAKAAELDPNSNKAIANLALLLLLKDQPAKAGSMMDKAGLPEATRRAVSRQAMQIRRAQQQRTTAMRVETASPTVSPLLPGRPARPEAGARVAGSTPAQGISANLLDRFDSRHANTGGQGHDPH